MAALIGLKKTDDRTFFITVRILGDLVQTGEFKLSEDGNSFTQTMNSTTPDGQVTDRVYVALYEKQH